MQTIDRYLMTLFGRSLAVILFALLTLYGLIEFLEKIDDFIEHRAALRFFFLYPLYHLPTMLANVLPMAVLLATFSTVGGLSRTGQLTAMHGGGISFNRVSRPLFLCALALAVVIFIGNLWLVPWTARETEYLMQTGVKGKSVQDATHENLYFRDGNRIISVARAFPSRGQILGLTVLEFNDQLQPEKRIQAASARHVEEGSWQLADVVVWEFSPEQRTLRSFRREKSSRLDLKRPPREMQQLWSAPEEMTFGELRHFTEKMMREGHDPGAYRLEAHMRISRAAIPLIMVLIGLPFALQRGRNASFSLGIAISLAIFLVYFLLYAVFSAFGAAGILPPLPAAWAANLLMTLFGAWLFLRVQG